jgi:hypothetical protein
MDLPDQMSHFTMPNDDDAVAEHMRVKREKIEHQVFGDQFGLLDWFAKLSKANRERTLKAWTTDRSTFERWLVYELALDGDW